MKTVISYFCLYVTIKILIIYKKVLYGGGIIYDFFVIHFLSVPEYKTRHKRNQTSSKSAIYHNSHGYSRTWKNDTAEELAHGVLQVEISNVINEMQLVRM